MKHRETFAQAAADHRQAIASVIGIIENLDRHDWSLARTPDKWSPAQIAQHLVLAYEPLLAELDGGQGFAVRLKWWQRVFLRWRYLPGILERGKFPSGAPSPKEARPRGDTVGPEEAVERLRERADRFERRLTEANASGPVRLTHAYFGKLAATQILRFLAVHARHHRDQFPNAGRAEPKSALGL